MALIRSKSRVVGPHHQIHANVGAREIVAGLVIGFAHEKRIGGVRDEFVTAFHPDAAKPGAGPLDLGLSFIGSAPFTWRTTRAVRRNRTMAVKTASIISTAKDRSMAGLRRPRKRVNAAPRATA